nr:alpha/beta hydrolase [Geodermatophilaceae bacterium]
AHGTRDRWVDNRMSLDFALRAKRIHPDVARFEVPGVGHALLRRAHDWHDFATNAALGILGLEPLWPLVANALHEESPAGLRVPLVVPRSTASAARP